MNDADKNLEDIYPLSPMQQGMLFHSVYAPAAAPYFEQFSCVIEGSLDLRALRAAWERVVARHPSLRTLFVWTGVPKPLQVVRRRVVLPWIEADWSGMDAGEQQLRWRAWLADDCRRRFRLDEAPLMRVAVIRFAPQRHRLTWSFHHIILDGWSVSLVLSELFAEYVGGASSAQPPPPPYREYVEWSRRQDLLLAEIFWREELEGVAGPFRLPFAHGERQPSAAPERYADHTLALDEVTSREIGLLAQASGVTLASVAQGAWALVLRSHVSQDPLFGITLAERPAEIANAGRMVGLCINTIPCRVRITESEEVGAWLRSIQRAQGRAREFEFAPLSSVQRWLSLERGAPLFDTLLVVENFPVAEALAQPQLPLAITNVEVSEATNYPVTLVVAPGRRSEIRLSYDPCRVGAAFARELLEHFCSLLRRFATASARTVHEWGQLGEVRSLGAGRPLLPETVSAPRACSTLHELFELQVQRFGSRPALVDGGRTITYAELDAWAQQIAGSLMDAGVGPEVMVGICARRSAGMVAAILGTLKAGGAYVPLDPSYPEDRLRWLAANTDVKVILADAASRDRVAERRVLLIDEPAGQPARRQPRHGSPASDAAAYVIYTSGSTGRPKGVVVTHRNVMRLFSETQRWFGFDEHDVWTLFHSYAFDFSVWEIFGALLHGGRLVVVPHAVSRSPEACYELLAQERVTVLNQTPSAFRQLMAVEEGRQPLPPLALRLVIFGGEALEPRMLEGWIERHGDEWPSLVNMYGITETTVHVTYRPLARADVLEHARSPIGEAIPDLQAHVLDGELREVAPGVSGELYVGGAGLARGYLNAPALTAERFIPDPYAAAPGARLYRTGDVVQRAAGGELQYLGRSDQQVKIRGFRIELPEIEHALEQHPGVSQAVVVPRDEEGGNRRLHAYVVLAPGSPSPPADLKAFLKERLPDYMLPATIRSIDRLPLTPTGKLDRRALVSAAPPGVEAVAAEVDEHDEAQSAMAAVWASVLGLPRVAIHDNFFALGGDSISALQVVSRARERNLFIDPKDVFEQQTVARLCAVARKDVMPAPRAEAVTGCVPVTPIQAWFFERHPVHFRQQNHALLLRCAAGISVAQMRRAVSRVFARHPALHVRFVSDGESWRQVAGEASGMPEMLENDLSQVPVAERAEYVRAAAAEMQQTLDPCLGPLFRAAAFVAERAIHRVLLVVHHLAVDVVSWQLLLDELGRALQAEPGHARRALPEAASLGYVHWAKQLAERVRDGQMDDEIAFWLDYLPAAPATLPLDAPHAACLEHSRRCEVVELGQDDTETVLGAPRTRAEDGLEAILLTAFAVALTRHAPGHEILIDVEGHGRDAIIPGLDTSTMVGWFTILHPLRCGAAAAGSSALEQVAALARERRRVPRRGLGFGCLRYLHPKADVRESLARRGQALASFNYLGRLDAFSGASSLEVMDEAVGPAASPASRLTHHIAFTAMVRSGRSRMRVDYGDTFSAATIRRLLDDAAAFVRHAARELRAGVAAFHPLSPGSSSPSLDRALAAVSYEGESVGD